MDWHITHLVNDIRDECSWCDTSLLIKRRLERRCAIQMNPIGDFKKWKNGVKSLVETHPEWITLDSIGTTREDGLFGC